MPGLPTSTALLARLKVFEPTVRPTMKGVRSHGSSWGESTITGRLGQRHADLLEMILFSALEHQREPDGRIHLLVDDYQVRKGLEKGYVASGSQYGVWLRELQTATLELTPDGWESPVTGRLIDEVGVSAERVKAPGGLRAVKEKDGERHLKLVILGQAMSKLIGKDVPCFYDPRLVADCWAGIAKAVVRHVLTHKKFLDAGWRLETVLNYVGAEDKSKWPFRRRELGACAEYLSGFGIRVENERVFRKMQV